MTLLSVRWATASDSIGASRGRECVDASGSKELLLLRLAR